MNNGKDLPGYKKKSFSLPYNGGEIWFEHLDGMYQFEGLVISKLEADKQTMLKPSTSAYICFVFDETDVTPSIVDALVEVITCSDKSFRKIAFVGLDREAKKKIKQLLRDYPIGFLKGLEDAKKWLL